MSTVKALACGKGMGTLERPLYSPGLLLEDDDLTSGVTYTRRLTQLLFSSLFGCGVICGLKIEAENICDGRKLKVKVSKGLGLDCAGNPIEVSSPVVLTYDPDCDRFPKSIWVVACYTERECGPRELSACDGSDRANTRYRAGYEIKLFGSQPASACSCEPPRENTSSSASDCRCPPGAHATGGAAPSSDKAKAADKEPRDCYADHRDGICSCDCGSSCIVIGRIDLTFKGDEVTIDEAKPSYDPVRRIRPVLVGMPESKLAAHNATPPPGGG
ncbi:hypothetical protein [Bradyrhizobium diazoefficiens]|uniref:hypothetical protein n=1 Tax=Bradyrhizobium diazoefficiens TaxID=1355477 RepID=UPI0004B42489|nr:hypothetical protein [Bradyrhizobium diazoefficiens]